MRTTKAPAGRTWLLSTGALLALVAVVLVSGLSTASSLGLYGWDFCVQYLSAARSVVEGGSPYPPLGTLSPDDVPPYVYPPLTAVATVPYTILPESVAVVVATLAALSAAVLALALVGLRDVRCYLAVLASAPVWNLLETANVTAALVLGLALAWRFRERAWPLALALGLGVAAKFLLWPMLWWAVVTRRARAVAGALAIAVAATALSWAAMGFAGLADYPALARELLDVWAPESYSFVGIADNLGLNPVVGRLTMLAVGGSLLAACLVLARQREDRRAFACAVAATVALAPIVWVHYVLLLLVPLAITRPRFSAAWLFPLVLWVCPRTGNGDGLEALVPMAVVAALVASMLVRPRAAGVAVEAA